MSASDNKNLDILLAANADVLTDQDAEYLRQLDVSDVEISAETDKRITRMIKRKSWLEALHTPMLVCKRIAAVFLIVCTIGFAVCMSVQEVRAYVINMIFEWSEKFVTVHYVPETTPPSIIKDYREPALQLSDTEKKVIMQNEIDNVILYLKDEGRAISYQQTLISNSPDLDSENCSIENVMISDYEAKLFSYEDGGITLTWHDNEYAYLMSADSQVISDELLIIMAESVYADVGQLE